MSAHNPDQRANEFGQHFAKHLRLSFYNSSLVTFMHNGFMGKRQTLYNIAIEIKWVKKSMASLGGLLDVEIPVLCFLHFIRHSNKLWNSVDEQG